MCQKPTTCIHALADDRNQEVAFGRFLDHSSVSYAEMLTTTERSPASARWVATCWRSRTPRRSTFPATPAGKHGFGRSGNDRDLGWFLHPTIAVDAAHGGIIGLAQVLKYRDRGGADHADRDYRDGKTGQSLTDALDPGHELIVEIAQR
jgi:hypothetical protein